jgi:hypothetical protein
MLLLGVTGVLRASYGVVAVLELLFCLSQDGDGSGKADGDEGGMSSSSSSFKVAL